MLCGTAPQLVKNIVHMLHMLMLYFSTMCASPDGMLISSITRTKYTNHVHALMGVHAKASNHTLFTCAHTLVPRNSCPHGT